MGSYALFFTLSSHRCFFLGSPRASDLDEAPEVPGSSGGGAGIAGGGMSAVGDDDEAGDKGADVIEEADVPMGGTAYVPSPLSAGVLPGGAAGGRRGGGSRSGSDGGDEEEGRGAGDSLVMAALASIAYSPLRSGLSFMLASERRRLASAEGHAMRAPVRGRRLGKRGGGEGDECWAAGSWHAPFPR